METAENPIKSRRYIQFNTMPNIMTLEVDDVENGQDLVFPARTRITSNPSTYSLLCIDSLFSGSLDKNEIDSLYAYLIENHSESLVLQKVEHKDIEFDIIYYLCGIIGVGDKAGISNISNGDSSEADGSKYWMSTLFENVPIKLVEEKDMPDPKIVGEFATETLGYYVSKDRNYNNFCLIYLCPKRIEFVAKQLNMELRLLYAIVLIHELAHAIMDSTNTIQNVGKAKDQSKEMLSEIDNAMEESLANMITLQYFGAAKDILDDGVFEKVEYFMNKQPDAYRFGILQYNVLRTDWRIWRNKKSVYNILEAWANCITSH